MILEKRKLILKLSRQDQVKVRRICFRTCAFLIRTMQLHQINDVGVGDDDRPLSRVPRLREVSLDSAATPESPDHPEGKLELGLGLQA